MDLALHRRHHREDHCDHHREGHRCGNRRGVKNCRFDLSRSHQRAASDGHHREAAESACRHGHGVGLEEAGSACPLGVPCQHRRLPLTFRLLRFQRQRKLRPTERLRRQREQGPQQAGPERPLLVLRRQVLAQEFRRLGPELALLVFQRQVQAQELQPVPGLRPLVTRPPERPLQRQARALAQPEQRVLARVRPVRAQPRRP